MIEQSVFIGSPPFSATLSHALFQVDISLNVYAMVGRLDLDNFKLTSEYINFGQCFTNIK